MASLDVWKVPSLLFSSWFYCLISEAANGFFFLMLIQHLKFEKPIFSEMQLLKNTRFSWGTQCLVLRYELNVYVKKITWVPQPLCGFTNLSSKSLRFFLLFTPNSHLRHLEVVCYLAIHLWEKEHWVNLDGLGLMVPEMSVHVCLALFLWARDKTGYHIAGTMWQQCHSPHDQQEARKDEDRI